MKFSKSNLKQIIKEELSGVLAETDASGMGARRSLDTAKEGDYVEISISDDGFDKNVEIIDSNNFEPTINRFTSVKYLAKIVQVATEKAEAPVTAKPELTPQQQKWSDYLAGRGPRPE
jgi:hypothetical protein